MDEDKLAMLKLAFLWHMHQPDYRGSDGVMRMPWVFLHAIKDYYEMPWLLSRQNGIRATFNLTPPLIEQLTLYEKEGVGCDRFLSLLLKEPHELGSEEQEWVVKICKSSRFDTMVKPLPRFSELFGNSSYKDSELVELEVLFLLSWCGNYLRDNCDTVAGLLEKGSGFDGADKRDLIEALLGFIPSILPFYSELQKKGLISISTTPMNHPILPLLIDMKSAVVSNPKTKIPSNSIPLAEDAKEQVDRAVELYVELFGTPPRGFWPAEGAVDEESVRLYAERGIEWIATDEEILFKSTGEEDRGRLYRPYGFGGLKILFRDHPLSDLIGFAYRFKEAGVAAADFVSRLEGIAKRAGNAVVPVILDGENAWEFYENNGRDFFEKLYSKLERAEWCKTVTMEEASKERSSSLERLHPGSWIDGSFDTWVGHPQKNAAWELLFQTKADFKHHEGELDGDVKGEIEEHFLVCECSDWFWWYGDDHHTEYAEDFDRLFRGHLIEIYRLMELAVPSDLFVPIVADRDLRSLISEPKFPIHPVIDGKVSSFFEWLGSGMMDESAAFSTMEGARGPIERIYWGQDEAHIYLRLDGDMGRLERGATVRIYTDSEEEPIALDTKRLPKRGYVKAALDKIVEISIDKRRFQGAGAVTLRMEIEIGTEAVQTLPGVYELRIDLGDDYSENWFV